MQKVFFGPWLPLAGVVSVSTLTAAYWTAFTLGYTSGESNLFTLSGYLITALVAWWVWEDSKSSHYWPFFSYGFFVYFAWPLILPHYLVKTRGWLGIVLFLLLAMSITSATWGWVLGLFVGVLSGEWSREEAWAAWSQFWWQ